MELGFGVVDFVFCVLDFGFLVLDVGFWVSGLGFGFWLEAPAWRPWRLLDAPEVPEPLKTSWKRSGSRALQDSRNGDWSKFPIIRGPIFGFPL